MISAMGSLALTVLAYLFIGYGLLCYFDYKDKSHGIHPIKILFSWPHILGILTRKWWDERRAK